MTAIVFDIGNVLVTWDPVPAFLPELSSRSAVEAFLERVDFRARNLRADRGERFANLAMEIEDLDDRVLFSRYVERYAKTLGDPIEGSWRLLNRLQRRGHATHALTNWSVETWPIGQTVHPRLQDAFEITIVSGKVGLAKPERAIFDLLSRRAGIAPGTGLFIDDCPINIEGARHAGFAAHQFTGPDALEADLTQRGLL